MTTIQPGVPSDNTFSRIDQFKQAAQTTKSSIGSIKKASTEPAGSKVDSGVIQERLQTPREERKNPAEMLKSLTDSIAKAKTEAKEKNEGIKKEVGNETHTKPTFNTDRYNQILAKALELKAKIEGETKSEAPKPPPAPPSPPPTPPTSPRSQLHSDINKGKELRHVEAEAKPVSARDQMLNQIKAGGSHLKRVEPEARPATSADAPVTFNTGMLNRVSEESTKQNPNIEDDDDAWAEEENDYQAQSQAQVKEPSKEVKQEKVEEKKEEAKEEVKEEPAAAPQPQVDMKALMQARRRAMQQDEE